VDPPAGTAAAGRAGRSRDRLHGRLGGGLDERIGDEEGGPRVRSGAHERRAANVSDAGCSADPRSPSQRGCLADEVGHQIQRHADQEDDRTQALSVDRSFNIGSTPLLQRSDPLVCSGAMPLDLLPKVLRLRVELFPGSGFRNVRLISSQSLPSRPILPSSVRRTRCDSQSTRVNPTSSAVAPSEAAMT
jgi:hypothetical protein